MVHLEETCDYSQLYRITAHHPRLSQTSFIDLPIPPSPTCRQPPLETGQRLSVVLVKAHCKSPNAHDRSFKDIYCSHHPLAKSPFCIQLYQLWKITLETNEYSRGRFQVPILLPSTKKMRFPMSPFHAATVACRT